MAIHKTEVQAGQTGFAHNRVEGQLVTGEIHFAEAGLPSNALLNGDTIEIVTLPIGAVVFPEYCRVNSSGIGSTGAISKIGDAMDDDRYSATSIAVANAGSTAVTPNVGTSVVSRHAVTDATKTVTATVTLSGSPTADRRLTFVIAYRMP